MTTVGLVALDAAASDALEAAASASAASAFLAEPSAIRPSVHVVKYFPSFDPPVLRQHDIVLYRAKLHTLHIAKARAHFCAFRKVHLVLLGRQIIAAPTVGVVDGHYRLTQWYAMTRACRRRLKLLVECLFKSVQRIVAVRIPNGECGCILICRTWGRICERRPE